MPDPRMLAGGIAVGLFAIIYFGAFVVPAARADALENAPTAARWLAWSVDIFFPVGLAISLMTRRGLPAPVFGARMVPIWTLCLGGLALLYLDVTVFVPATTAAFHGMLVNFIGPSSWITPFAYWLVWPVIFGVGALSVGLAAGYRARSVAGSFGRGFG